MITTHMAGSAAQTMVFYKPKSGATQILCPEKLSKVSASSWKKSLKSASCLADANRKSSNERNHDRENIEIMSAETQLNRRGADGKKRLA